MHQRGISTILVVLVASLAVISGYFIYQKQFKSTPPIGGSEQTVCTQDAKLCPDGSYVGRSGPNCEFTSCPASPSVDTSGWKTHIDEVWRLSIKYPADMTVGKDSINEINFRFPNPNPKFSGDWGSINIGDRFVDGKMTLLEAIRQDFVYQPSTFDKLIFDHLTVDGTPALGYKKPDCSNCYFVRLIKNNKFVHISLLSTKDISPSNDQIGVFNIMLSTLRFTQ